MYKTIDRHATVETVKKRIKNMRTAYLRELKKKLASEINAFEFCEPYEPNLWYFYDFDFLKDVEILADCVAAGANTIATATATSNSGGVVGNHVSNVTTFPSTEEEEDPLLKPTPSVKVLKRKKSFENCKRSYLGRDDAAIYAEAWACSYRKLSEEQKFYAKKACDEILVLGQLEKLTLNTVKTDIINDDTNLMEEYFDIKQEVP
ncbi:hypothetical protein DOY81_013909 [Sarcophaga bullata]|nr:hypothetical protein DOY81_013909 [Sarcophaga bullata]